MCQKSRHMSYTTNNIFHWSECKLACTKNLNLDKNATRIKIEWMKTFFIDLTHSPDIKLWIIMVQWEYTLKGPGETHWCYNHPGSPLHLVWSVFLKRVLLYFQHRVMFSKLILKQTNPNKVQKLCSAANQNNLTFFLYEGLALSTIYFGISHFLTFHI